MPKIALQALEKIRLKLLDLTSRNRLLNYKETARTIRIIDELPDEIYRILVLEGKSMELLPLPEREDDEDQEELPLMLSQKVATSQKKSLPSVDQCPELPASTKEKLNKHIDSRLQTLFSPQYLEKRCKKLHSEARLAIEETGSNLLYLAIGFLEWYEDENSQEQRKAPLILIPVAIERTRLDKETNCYKYVLSYNGEDIETNLSLALKLDGDFNLILPHFDNEHDMPEAFFNKISKIVAGKKRWRIAREAIIGLFSFSKLLMYKDLDPSSWPKKIDDYENLLKILRGNSSSSGEETIYGEENIIELHPKIKETALILDADSSQLAAILDAAWKAQNLVIEGPPGTGKSQTIANIISASLANGKTVLFVAEKKAALEVVRARLDHAKLGNFCLELHSHKTQKGKLHADIKKRIESKYQSEVQIDKLYKELTAKRDSLISYTNIANQKAGSSDNSIYEIFWKVELYRSQLKDRPIRLAVDNVLTLDQEQINDRIQILEDIVKLRSELPNAAIDAWKGFSPKDILPGDEEKIGEVLQCLSLAAIGIDNMLEGKDSFPPIENNLNTFRRIADIKLDLLDHYPAAIEIQYVAKFIDPANVNILKQLHETIENYNKQFYDAEIINNLNPTLAEVASFKDATFSLIKLGYEDKTSKDISNLMENIAEVIEETKNTISLASKQALVIEPPKSIDDFEKIIRIGKHVKNAPQDLAFYAHSEHADLAASNLFQKAQGECLEILKIRTQLSDIFNFQLLPDYNEIQRLSLELSNYETRFFRIFSSKYRAIKREIKKFLIPQKSPKKGDLWICLSQLAIVVKDTEAFQNNQKFKFMFGSVYVGIYTKWADLSKVIEWSQELRDIIGSESVTKPFLKNYGSLRDDILMTCEKIAQNLKNINEVLLKVKINYSATGKLENLCEIFNEKLIDLEKNIQENSRLFVKFFTMDNINIKQLHESAVAFLMADKTLRRIRENTEFQGVCGHYYNAERTDTMKLITISQWVDDLKNNGNFENTDLTWLFDSQLEEKRKLLSSLIDETKQFFSNFNKCCDDLEQNGSFDATTFFSRSETSLSASIINTAKACMEQINYLPKLSDYCRMTSESENIGMKSVVDLIATEQISLEDCVPLYTFTIYDSMARDIIRKHPKFAMFNQAQHDNLISRYMHLDKEFLKCSSARIGNVVSKKNVPRGIGSGYAKDYTELSLLNRECHKIRRHIPIRQLVKRAGSALQALKPCFMMSPMSVAQYLEAGKLSFDILIMDEASQIKPEDALGSVIRAQQLIVVGDPKQLPPTSFFDRIGDDANDDDDERTVIQDTESILDVCIDNFQTRRLLWHYRSDNEKLIAFSNYHFYDNELLLFPTATPQGISGIYSHFIAGATYSKRRNRKEAEAVVAAIAEHFKTNPNLSLGIATINREQSDLIEDILEKNLKINPWLESKIKDTEESTEPFFIKNLENVQGDERDVIFISTTYGPDAETGRVYQRFGPITGDKGWRRLNVIFTRAKKRVDLFTSMRPSDILPSLGSSQGVHALKAYLEYAATGRLSDEGKTTNREPDSDFEVSVTKILNNYGYRTEIQVGVAGFFIDIGVKHPERDEFILGVECDGKTYHSAKSIRDRDRLRQEILEKKGWRLHRIWSTDWYKNRDIEVKRLCDRINNIISSEKATTHVVMPKQKTSMAADEYEKIKPLPTRQLAAKQPRTLEEKLMQYKQSNITPRFPDDSNSILRKEMMEHFIKKMPTVKKEFYNAIPLTLRENTDGRQMQFLEDILEIIEEHAD